MFHNKLQVTRTSLGISKLEGKGVASVTNLYTGKMLPFKYSTHLLLAHLGLSIAGKALERPAYDPFHQILDWGDVPPNLNSGLLDSTQAPAEAQRRLKVPTLAIPTSSGTELAQTGPFRNGLSMDNVPNDIDLGASLPPLLPNGLKEFNSGTSNQQLLQNFNAYSSVAGEVLEKSPRYIEGAPSCTTSRDGSENHISYTPQSERNEAVRCHQTWRRYKKTADNTVDPISTPSLQVQSSEPFPAWFANSPNLSFDSLSKDSLPPDHTSIYDSSINEINEPSSFSHLESPSYKRLRFTDHFMDPKTPDYNSKEWDILLDYLPIESEPTAQMEFRENHSNIGTSSHVANQVNQRHTNFPLETGGNYGRMVDFQTEPQSIMVEQADINLYLRAISHPNVDAKAALNPHEKKMKMFKFDMDVFENCDAIGLDALKIKRIRTLIEKSAKKELLVSDISYGEVHQNYFHKLSRFEPNDPRTPTDYEGLTVDEYSRMGHQRKRLESFV
ncbi:uncharacterized protein PGTG_11084 [Puccinia graminis f. sp. tritici CRL 75-36-700-3]|uniref:Uncharacterized protein n=1 Tax=Puccinia graminis f. sp. tritici (strain CRL 75-36-700-3 / race SCCL) TaxID=418459 RepID=E3KNB9_PUCGT|nr:uncharacterized protein PGTG_11084 [Puccinia graminis f. sp. tritici CRL 75-36-700-3]EFP85755.2 hypothetical protein PGTG_11084 [Puccinia graminis f. sp. tritici CRL 75-36-700-3]